MVISLRLPGLLLSPMSAFVLALGLAAQPVCAADIYGYIDDKGVRALRGREARRALPAVLSRRPELRHGEWPGAAAARQGRARRQGAARFAGPGGAGRGFAGLQGRQVGAARCLAQARHRLRTAAGPDRDRIRLRCAGGVAQGRARPDAGDAGDRPALRRGGGQAGVDRNQALRSARQHRHRLALPARPDRDVPGPDRTRAGGLQRRRGRRAARRQQDPQLPRDAELRDDRAAALRLPEALGGLRARRQGRRPHPHGTGGAARAAPSDVATCRPTGRACRAMPELPDLPPPAAVRTRRPGWRPEPRKTSSFLLSLPWTPNLRSISRAPKTTAR